MAAIIITFGIESSTRIRKEQQVAVEKDGVFLSRTDQGTLTLAQIIA
jgi:hypothetical protein